MSFCKTRSLQAAVDEGGALVTKPDWGMKRWNPWEREENRTEDAVVIDSGMEEHPMPSDS